MGNRLFDYGYLCLWLFHRFIDRHFVNKNFTKECDCMGKAILAMIVTVIVGFMGSAICANWVNAPEWGVVLAVAVMGGFIIYFNDKK